LGVVAFVEEDSRQVGEFGWGCEGGERAGREGREVGAEVKGEVGGAERGVGGVGGGGRVGAALPSAGGGDVVGRREMWEVRTRW
jgi:hypothetical protein